MIMAISNFLLQLLTKEYSVSFQRAYTVGIGGPVGSGKTALVLALCKHLRDTHNICVVTNDIFTRFVLS